MFLLGIFIFKIMELFIISLFFQMETSEYEEMVSPTKPVTQTKLQKTQSTADILNDTLNSSTKSTPANLPMIAVRDYRPTSTQLDGVSVRSGTIVSALYKTGKFLFVRTPDNNTGFLPSSVVRPLSSMSDIRNPLENTYQNLPKRPTRSVTFVSPGNYSNSSSCAYASPGQCHCHSCVDNHCRGPPVVDSRLCNSTCPCCVESPINTLMASKNQHRNNKATESRKNGSFDDSSFDSCYSSSDASGNSNTALDEAFISKRCDSCDKKTHPLQRTPLSHCGSFHHQCCCSPCHPGMRNSTYTISDHERYRRRRFLSTQRGARLTVIFDFQGHFDGDISVRRQDVVTLLDDDGPDWLWIRRSDGKEGFIPRAYAVNLEALNLDPYCRTTYL